MEYGVCPVCNGTGQLPLTDAEKKYSWNKDRTHGNCYNCGGQYMSMNPKGKVPLDKNGQPCTHKYTRRTVGRCLNEYTCDNCGDRYQIDSSD
jgi:hypothetical protein